MPLEIAFLCGAVGTMGTSEGLLTCVGADVGPDTLNLHCLEGTVRAGEWLLRGVRAEMLGESGGDDGGVGTVGTGVEPWGVGWWDAGCTG